MDEELLVGKVVKFFSKLLGSKVGIKMGMRSKEKVLKLL